MARVCCGPAVRQSSGRVRSATRLIAVSNNNGLFRFNIAGGLASAGECEQQQRYVEQRSQSHRRRDRHIEHAGPGAECKISGEWPRAGRSTHAWQGAPWTAAAATQVGGASELELRRQLLSMRRQSQIYTSSTGASRWQRSGRPSRASADLPSQGAGSGCGLRGAGTRPR